MNKYVLITLKSNWADEFDVEAFWATTIENWNELIYIIRKLDNDFERDFFFGTNEYITLDKYFLLSGLSCQGISEDFYNSLISFLGQKFGLIDIEFIMELLFQDYKED